MIARTRVLFSKAETRSTHTLRIEKPRGFDFKPVQFVGLEFETDEGPIEYSMSLACSPTRDYLEFGARLSETPWKRAFAALKPGDEVEIDGPYGHFVLDEARPAVHVAGGIGITPLKGMMEYATDKRLPPEVRLLYSNRSADDVAYRDELEALARHNPRIRIVHTLTGEPPADWEGLTGRVDETMLRSIAEGLRDPVYYVCGKPGMVEVVARMLFAMGVPRNRILYEQFWGYE